MKNSLKLNDPLFAGILLFQIAAFGLAGRADRSDNLPVEHLTSMFRPKTISVGTPLPNFTVYDETGRRATSLIQNRPTLIIFKTSCTCDDERITSWISNAERNGEFAVVITPSAPDELPKLRKDINLSVQLLSIRYDELLRLNLIDSRMPAAVHVAPNSTVLGMDWS